MAWGGMGGLKVAEDLANHEGELRVVEPEADEDEVILLPETFKGLAVQSGPVGLGVFAGIQDDPLRTLPVAVEPEHRADLGPGEDLSREPVVDLVVILPGGRAGGEAAGAQVHAGELSAGS